jgi:cobalt-precorrin-5B (C1)-methyltransferase
LPPGEPAINPVPRTMIRNAIAEAAAQHHAAGDVVVEISIPGGEKLAERTLNGRLGILGGLSILGTTGIVIPYSCSAWIHSIHRGIDVARGIGLDHIAGATGATSERAVQQLHGLPETALIDMGDFVGGMLKYLRRHPVPKVTVAGGMGKMTKLGQGLLDLHSRRGAVDLDWLAAKIIDAGGTHELAADVRAANSAKHAFELADAAGISAAAIVAEAAWVTAASVLRDCETALEIVIFDRAGQLLAKTAFRKIH